MVSKYFKIKTETPEFKEHLSKIFDELKDKKILLYGAEKGFIELDKKYNFKSKFNIVGIADLKFEKNTSKPFMGYKKVAPSKINNEYFDTIIITNEVSSKIEKYLKKMELKCNIKTVFVENIKDEQENLNYLYKFKFDKTLQKLIKQMRGQRVILYGAGSFLELANKYFDLKDLNVIAIADKRFSNHKKDEKFLGWNVCSIDEIEELNPDYILVSTKFYLDIIYALKTNKFQNMKFKPLVEKDFFTLLKEVIC